MIDKINLYLYIKWQNTTKSVINYKYTEYLK